MYQFLCEKVVGSERVVKCRRQYFCSVDYLNNGRKSYTRFVSSGSKAEGMDLPGSDIDVMYVHGAYQVNKKNKPTV